jgi:alkanesulfonate monooxygenase SsuD/methylene tetrahydromethanopterin reductase-like flavin-dependent oxidoreductase (luciferase family)
MMAAAGVTKHLRRVPRLLRRLPPPVVLAKELATVDLLTDGRLEVGLGAGWVAAEYEGMGIPMDARGRIDRLSEYVGLVRAHWTGEPLDIDGTYVHVHGFEGRPPPVQTPHPPIMIGGGARVLRTGAAGRHRQLQLQQLDRDPRLGQRGQRHGRAHQEKIQWVRGRVTASTSSRLEVRPTS